MCNNYTDIVGQGQIQSFPWHYGSSCNSIGCKSVTRY